MDPTLIKFKELYLTTAGDYIKVLSSGIEDLGILNTKEKLEEMHRDAHSLKGQSLAMQYITTGKMSQVLERFFRKVMDENLTINNEQGVFIKNAVNRIAASIENIKTQDKELNLEHDVELLKSNLNIVIE